MKLVQKQLFKGAREFEIVDDTVSFRIRTGLKEKSLTVDLRMLNPDPVVNGAFLEFHSRVKCDPLLSLLIDKPDSKAFTAFVDELRQRARREYNAFAGLRNGAMPEAMTANVFDEPPDFDEPGNNRIEKKAKPVKAAEIDTALRMLEQYLEADQIAPLLDALRALKAEPANETRFEQLARAFDGLGPRQGAVLTYAPYVGVLLADEPFG